MARSLRIHVPGGMYHVTLRGNHRHDIFFASRDRDLLTEIFAEALDRWNARVHAYCYMTNHIHALVQVSDSPLGRLVLHVAGRYARALQASLQTTGHLFERRYHAVLVDTDSYLLELLRYIHLNPVRGGLAASPDDYPWSSHHVYSGRRGEPWVTTDFALSMLHSDRSQAMLAYRRFVGSCAAETMVSPLTGSRASDCRILGDDEFARRILGHAWLPRSSRTLEQIVSEACGQFGVTLADMRSASRERHLTRARAWITHQAVSDRVASVAAVARYLEHDESSLRYAARRYHRPP
jgi:REP-associated tyrosine transposase